MLKLLLRVGNRSAGKDLPASFCIAELVGNIHGELLDARVRSQGRGRREVFGEHHQAAHSVERRAVGAKDHEFIPKLGLVARNRPHDVRCNGHAKAVHSRLLNTLIRHAPGPVRVSSAAQIEGKRRGLGDLRGYSWYQQMSEMGDVGRKVFAFDHFYTVADLRRRMDGLETPTVVQVRNILRLSSVAWILRKEDDRLNELGFRSRRVDPHAAYKKAGIRLLAGRG